MDWRCITLYVVLPIVNFDIKLNLIFAPNQFLLGWFQRGSVPTPAGRYRPGYRPAPVDKRGNRERGAIVLPTGVGAARGRYRLVGTDLAGRYRLGVRSAATWRSVIGQRLPRQFKFNKVVLLCQFKS